MKKVLLILCTLSLVFDFGVTSVYAGPEADARKCDNGRDDDRDGLIDCADPDCDPFCGGGCTPTGVSETICNGVDDDCDSLIDEDYSPTSTNCGVGVCASTGQTTCVDGVEGDTCSPGSPTESPEATCDDSLDNDCDGATDTADSDCGGGGTHSGLTWNDWIASPPVCMSCHSTQYSDMFSSTHYQWIGAAPDMINGPTSAQGKYSPTDPAAEGSGVNSYCINILGNWPVCGSCHVGRGPDPRGAVGQENIDCLVCHSLEYANARARQPDGSNSVANPTDSMVQNVTKPTRRNCLVCHAKAGGGNGVKRGDLSISIPGVLDNATDNNTDANFDVHMNVNGDPVDGNVTCQGCHVFINHRVIGKGSDLRPTDDVERGSEVACTTCHANKDTTSGHGSAETNRHVARVACQSCHIPTYAKVPTEIERDWTRHHDGSPADGVSGPGHPHTTKASNLTPEYRFWNRKSDNGLLYDTPVIDPATNAYPTSRPVGDVTEGKLYPFKYKTAYQPRVNDPGHACDGMLVAIDTFGYLKVHGDINQAIIDGLANMNCAGAAVEWVHTDTYQLINHGVNPAAGVADCTQCHPGSRTDLDTTTNTMLDDVGYALKGPEVDICAQCHRAKSPKDHESMHAHLDKGSGMDCLFCHTFTRPERNLCSPCDQACINEFVDNVPYDHSADCTP